MAKGDSLGDPVAGFMEQFKHLYGSNKEPIMCMRCERLLQYCICENPCKHLNHNVNCACKSLVTRFLW